MNHRKKEAGLDKEYMWKHTERGRLKVDVCWKHKRETGVCARALIIRRCIRGGATPPPPQGPFLFFRKQNWPLFVGVTMLGDVGRFQIHE